MINNKIDNKTYDKIYRECVITVKNGETHIRNSHGQKTQPKDQINPLKNKPYDEACKQS